MKMGITRQSRRCDEIAETRDRDNRAGVAEGTRQRSG
jgi:hypothetical protein